MTGIRKWIGDGLRVIIIVLSTLSNKTVAIIDDFIRNHVTLFVIYWLRVSTSLYIDRLLAGRLKSLSIDRVLTGRFKSLSIDRLLTGRFKSLSIDRLLAKRFDLLQNRCQFRGIINNYCLQWI